MLEHVGVFGAIGRGYALTTRAFWRIFGIAAAHHDHHPVAGSMLALPDQPVVRSLLGGGLGRQYAALVARRWSTPSSSVVTAAFVAPFTAAVTSLQYVDQRIRKEAFDVELMTRAGITAS